MDRRDVLKSVSGVVLAGCTKTFAMTADKVDGSSAYREFAKALCADPAWAWSYHCNLACAAMDEGLKPAAANRAAARFMKAAFGIDTLQGVYKEMGKDPQ